MAQKEKTNKNRERPTLPRSWPLPNTHYSAEAQLNAHTIDEG